MSYGGWLRTEAPKAAPWQAVAAGPTAGECFLALLRHLRGLGELSPPVCGLLVLPQGEDPNTDRRAAR